MALRRLTKNRNAKQGFLQSRFCYNLEKFYKIYSINAKIFCGRRMKQITYGLITPLKPYSRLTGERRMQDLRSIPDDVKWKISAKVAARLPAIYEIVFSPILGERYDELEQEIWVELSKFGFDIARSLNLPINSAENLTQSMSIVRAILFGPDYKDEVMEVGDDGAVTIVKHCPFVAEAAGVGASPDRAFKRCLAFTLSTQKIMNPHYKSRFVRAMCMGDRQCEIKVDKEESSKREPKKGPS
jgi:hypothetical protein